MEISGYTTGHPPSYSSSQSSTLQTPQHQSQLPFSIPTTLVPSDEERQPGNTLTCLHLSLWFHAQPWKRVPCERFAPEA
jgi:hypothetical protein